jgi:rod shape-determining protein MreB
MGSARTRLYVAGRGVIADIASAAPRPGGRLERAVSRGMVVRIDAATALLSPLLGRLHVPGRRRHRVLACVPQGTAAQGAAALRTAVSHAGAHAVALVPSVLAAAVGAGLDVGSEDPNVLIDIGAELSEIAIVRLGNVTAATAVPMGWQDLGPHAASIRQLSDRIAGAFEALLDQMPERIQGDLMLERVTLTGGGARLPELRFALSMRLRLHASVPQQPELAVIHGAGLMLAVGAKTRLWG